ncbi:Hypothetical predicted protein [Lecanosticta acicola]|uniref:Uncharacterized protein n=1 Tax=Lecanosticta acicola TaxID=111012 RepID=A0AAI8Z8U7_9PEZI|nr:Hypothetical predicted protein [Lecanosticta acicola]
MPSIVANDAPTIAIPRGNTSAPTTSMKPPQKRIRLHDEAYGSILERRMEDLETSLEVDYLILDYLLHQAIQTCLKYPNTPTQQEASAVERCLVQVDEFLALFKMRYADCKFDPEMRYRLLLCQVVPLFTQRLTRNSSTPSKQRLDSMRESNGARARRWIGDASRLPTAAYDTSSFDSGLPIELHEVEQNRARVLSSSGVAQEDDAYDDAFYGTSACLSLLDLIPLFMEVTAACNNMLDIACGPSRGLMELIANLMLQACLEQYLIFGASGSDAMDEAFAWGYKSTDGEEEEQDGELKELFRGSEEEEEEVQGWKETRERALQQLLGGDDDTPQRLSRLASAHPLAETLHTVTDYLESLAAVTPRPVLAQLEGGKMDGMSEAETREFLRDCGLDVADFYA